MPNKNGTQTISNENQVAVVDHNASPLQSSESKTGKESRIHRKRILVILVVVVLVIASAMSPGMLSITKTLTMHKSTVM